MTLPHVTAGEVARAAEQNALIDTVNDHSTSLDLNAGTLGEHTSRITALEGRDVGSDAGAYFGQWGDDNALRNGVQVSTAGGHRIIDLDYAVGTPVGCSLSAGTFTPNYSGVWALSISLQYTAKTSVRAMWLGEGTAATSPTTAKLGLQAAPSADAQTTSVITRMTAGASYSVYAAVWQGGEPIYIWRAHGNTVTAAWLGP